MTRYIQCPVTHKLIPSDEYSRPKEAGSAVIFGDVQSFVSPVDGTVITDRKQLREHNKRNNVVSAEEFDQGFLARKAKERTAGATTQEVFERKQAIYNQIIRAENGR